MNRKVLGDRVENLRNGSLRTSRHRLVKKFLWIGHLFTAHVIPYLVKGEISQIKLLISTIHQKDRYIAYLLKDPIAARNEIIQQKRKGITFKDLTKWSVRVLLAPISLVVFMVGKAIRVCRLRNIPLNICVDKSDKENANQTAYTGNAHEIPLVTGNGRHYPGGLLYFRYKLSAAKTAKPVLNIDPGTGFANEFAIPLNALQASEQGQLIELPPKTQALKFSSGADSSDYTLTDVALVETNLFQAARHRAAQQGRRYKDAFYEIWTRKFPAIRRPTGFRINYPSWIERFDILTATDRQAIHNHLEAIQSKKCITLILHCNKAAPELLERTIHAVSLQYYTNWELLIIADAADLPAMLAVVAPYEKTDARIRLVADKPASSGEDNNPVLHAKGDYITFIKPGDVLPEHALYMVAAQLENNPEVKLLYADHDQMDDYGRRYDPWFKPDWDYDLFLGCNYLGNLVIYAADILTAVMASGRVEHDAVRPAALLYRVVEHISAAQVLHIPFILCHQYPAANHAGDAEADNMHISRLLNEHLERTIPSATAMINDNKNHLFRIQRTVDEQDAPVSLLIPTRNCLTLLSNCVDGILHKTDYANYEVIIIDNNSDDPATLEYLESVQADPRVSVIHYPGAFNFSALNNFAVQHAGNEYIGLLNNDISVIDGGWLREMMSHLVRPDVGIVGAKLLYGNETIQHGGVIIGLGGIAGHAFRHFPKDSAGTDNRLLLTQQLSCVTGACMLTKKSIYTEVGGLDEVNLKIAFNDVDYCLKVREQGYKIIWTPFAELYHLESASRGSDRDAENIARWEAEYNFMKIKWRKNLRHDPAYNPNLTITGEDFSLAHRPRVIRPWERYL
jgi:GT2 family glycosyltransferase